MLEAHLRTLHSAKVQLFWVPVDLQITREL
jgi:hypothetical protein